MPTKITPDNLKSTEDFSYFVPSVYERANAALVQANAAYTRANNSINANTNGTITGNLTVTGNVLINSYVTVASLPSFLAGINSNTDASVNTGTVLPANITQYNVGNYYNTSTYRFTAPVAGLYNFTVGIYFTGSGSNNQSMQVGLRKNGSYINGGSDAYANILIPQAAVTNSTTQMVLNVQFKLAANDYVDVAPRTNTLRHYQGHYWFQGYLIG